MLDVFVKFLTVLNSNQGTGQVAFSLVLGLILGLTPLWMPHNLLVLLFIILLRVNLSAVFVGFAVFSGLSYAVDPLAMTLGDWILHQPEWQAYFTQAYNQAWWRLTHFNNTLVMGSVVLAYALSLPAFVVFWVLVRVYRKRFIAWVKQFKFVQALKAASSVKSVTEIAG